MLVENKDLKKDVTRPKLFLRTYIVTNLNEKMTKDDRYSIILYRIFFFN